MRDELTCLDFQNQLEALVEGTIKGSDQVRLLAHANECEECRVMLAVEQHVTSLSPTEFEKGVPDRMVREMWPAIRSRLGMTALLRRKQWSRWVMPSLAAAAALLLFLSGVLYGQNRHLQLQLKELSSRGDQALLSMRTVGSGSVPALRGITAGSARWRRGLSYQDEFTVGELLDVLDRLPKTAVLLRVEEITAVSQSYPMWRSMLDDTMGNEFDTTDGIQAGEAKRLIESMNLPTAFRIRASRLATLAQPLRSYRNVQHSTVFKDE